MDSVQEGGVILGDVVVTCAFPERFGPGIIVGNGASREAQEVLSEQGDRIQGHRAVAPLRVVVVAGMLRRLLRVGSGS